MSKRGKSKGKGKSQPAMPAVRAASAEDVVVEAQSLTASDDPAALQLPDSAVTATWAGVSPPRAGWTDDGAIAEFDIRTRSKDLLAGQLSGGNQQRLVLARELSRPADLVVACEPTRGLDLAAVDLVHQRLVAARDVGAQEELVSSDLDELLTLADRILVCYGGEIVADLPADTPPEQIGLLMAPGRP